MAYFFNGVFDEDPSLVYALLFVDYGTRKCSEEVMFENDAICPLDC